MGDVICKWRVANLSNLKELVTWLPKEKMHNDDYRELMERDFLRTGYQLACQLGLYYIDEDENYIPRFDHNLSDDEANAYLHKWILRYYVPNPYTKSLDPILLRVCMEANDKPKQARELMIKIEKRRYWKHTH